MKRLSLTVHFENDQKAVVEVGVTIARNLSAYHVWVALILVITNHNGKRGVVFYI